MLSRRLVSRLARILATASAVVVSYLLFRSLAPAVAERASPQSVLEQLQGLLNRHGCALVLLLAFAEGVPPVSFVVSGLALLAVGGIAASQGAISLPLVIASGSMGLSSGFLAAYAMGRHGWGPVVSRLGLRKALRRTVRRLRGASPLMFVIMLGHPTLGGVAATAAGVLQRRFREVAPAVCVAAPASATAWITLGYLLGPHVLQLATGPVVLFAIVGAALIPAVASEIRSRRKTRGLSGQARDGR